MITIPIFSVSLTNFSIIHSTSSFKYTFQVRTSKNSRYENVVIIESSNASTIKDSFSPAHHHFAAHHRSRLHTYPSLLELLYNCNLTLLDCHYATLSIINTCLSAHKITKQLAVWDNAESVTDGRTQVVKVLGKKWGRGSVRIETCRIISKYDLKREGFGIEGKPFESAAYA